MSAKLPPTFPEGFQAFLNSLVMQFTIEQLESLLIQDKSRTIVYTLILLLESSTGCSQKTMEQMMECLSISILGASFSDEVLGSGITPRLPHFRQHVLKLRPRERLGSAEVVEFLNRTAIVQEALRHMGSGSMRVGGVATGWLHRGWSVSSWKTFAEHFANVFREDPSCKVEGEPVQDLPDKVAPSRTTIVLGRMGKPEGLQDWQEL